MALVQAAVEAVVQDLMNPYIELLVVNSGPCDHKLAVCNINCFSNNDYSALVTLWTTKSDC